MTHPQVGGDTGEQGTAPRDIDDAWKVGAGIEPDDAVEGEAAAQAAEDLGDARPADSDDSDDDLGHVPHDVTDAQLEALENEAAP